MQEYILREGQKFVIDDNRNGTLIHTEGTVSYVDKFGFSIRRNDGSYLVVGQIVHSANIHTGENQPIDFKPADEPLKFISDSPQLRIELLKMVSSGNKNASAHKLINEATTLLDWINLYWTNAKPPQGHQK